MTSHFAAAIANRIILFICIFSLYFIPAISFAEEPEVEIKTDPDICPDSIFECISDDDDDDDDEFFSFLDSPHKNISSGIEFISGKMDAFFSNEKFYRETTDSYVRYRIDTILREHGDTSTIGDLRIRLDLPITRKKLKLLIESDPAELEDDKDRIAKQKKSSEDSSYYIGIETKEKKRKKWRISRSIGVKARFPLDPYVRIRFTRDYPYDYWTLRVNETLYWFDSKGSGFDTYLDFERKITEKTLFRASSAARWADEDDFFNLSQFFSVLHTITDRRATSSYFGIFGKSQPEIHATDYLLGFNYRQKIHRDWLFIEINPEIQYSKITRFNPDHRLTLRLEAFFGSQYL